MPFRPLLLPSARAQRFFRAHAAFNALAAFMATMLCLAILGGRDLAAAAFSSCACAAAAAPFAFAARLHPAAPCASDSEGAGRRRFLAVVGFVAVSAAAFVAIPLAAASDGFSSPSASLSSGGSGESASHSPHLPLLLSASSSPALFDFSAIVAICVGTGIYEEALFRVAIARACAEGLKRRFSARLTRGRLMLASAALSSVLFAFMHLSLPPEATWSLTSAAQFVLKPVQAFLFGMALSLLYFRRGRFIEIALLHIGYDMVALAPGMAVAGSLPATYLTGDSTDLAALTAAVLCLAASLAVAAGMFRGGARRLGAAKAASVVRYPFDEWTDERAVGGKRQRSDESDRGAAYLGFGRGCRACRHQSGVPGDGSNPPS